MSKATGRRVISCGAKIGNSFALVPYRKSQQFSVFPTAVPYSTLGGPTLLGGLARAHEGEMCFWPFSDLALERTGENEFRNEAHAV
jgi:hypothetical protein